ncbi:hypothetical protein NIASO_07740 [Niabella soli DSM 19437]|uniref:Uncharacterized protein n=1 Tax=Niabella soli DSM 19437 TaxID=929713 RepID=W0F6K2_9BACT|nr:hypothetical protein NIASO_07740 [Niabella soli DSM 19437]
MGWLKTYFPAWLNTETIKDKTYTKYTKSEKPPLPNSWNEWLFGQPRIMVQGSKLRTAGITSRSGRAGIKG